jgi:hypothetical protein
LLAYLGGVAAMLRGCVKFNQLKALRPFSLENWTINWYSAIGSYVVRESGSMAEVQVVSELGNAALQHAAGTFAC